MRLLLLPLYLGSATALADGITIDHPRARPSLGAAKNSVAFFTIHNNTDKVDTLLSIESDVAGKVQLHTHSHVNGVFKMRRVEAIEIPAHGMVELKSGGLHVMMMGVRSKLKIGDAFELKLNFEHNPAVTISIPVEKIGS